MSKTKPKLSPDQLFAAALEQTGPSLSEGELRLLLSGVALLRGNDEKRLTENEQKAINGMSSFVAYTQNVSEEIVTTVLTTALNVDEVKALPSSRYDDAMEYLMNLQIEKIIN